jgi:hypothetical protein
LYLPYIDNIGRDPNGNTHTPIGRGYWIPKNGNWVLADYDHEAAYITEQNTASDGYLAPDNKNAKSGEKNSF